MPNFEIPVAELRKRPLMLCTPMYGGIAAGMFTRSVADLAAQCTNYGIPLQMYFLFNESLITRARNYCVDEFMRSSSTHLMFIDSDIGFNPNDVIAMLALMSEESDYDILTGPYPKKCLPNSARLMTEDGEKTIAHIVNGGYRGRVLSQDAKGRFRFSRITNAWVEPNRGKKWVGLQTSSVRPRNVLVCTDDHEVAYVDDVLNPVIRYTAAKNMKGKHLVRYPNETDKNRLNPLLNMQQLSILVGTALGDGHVGDAGGFTSVHGEAQKEYENYKRSILNGFRTNAQTKTLRHMLYEDDRRKTVKNVLHLLDEAALAFMYMDDGNAGANYHEPSLETCETSWWTDGIDCRRAASRPGDGWVRGRKLEHKTKRWKCTIATMSFTREDNELLVQHLANQWGIEAKIYKAGSHCQLAMDADNTEKFFSVIAPYVHTSMEYKLSPEFRGGKKAVIDTTPLEYACSEVVAVVDHEFDSHLYDIEVEDDHNFLANGVLVHNCISWEKVKRAVDKGFGDQNPNDLERFVGDYVFNPKGTSGVIPLNEPVEVLEAGTGFMMIRKKTFEKFRDAFPQYSYKPDHVRTAAFDGSREITMYFQAEIDAKSKRYLSEDYWWCQKVQELGMKTWLCPWMQLQHMGSYVFGGSLADLAAVGAAATADVNELGKMR